MNSNSRDSIVKQGLLKVKKKNPTRWSTRWAVVRRDRNNTATILELYNSQQSAQSGKSDKIYEFTNDAELTLALYDGQARIIFMNYKKNENRQFLAIDEIEANEWKKAFELKTTVKNRSCSINGSLSSSSSSNNSYNHLQENLFLVRMLDKSKVKYQDEIILKISNEQIIVTEPYHPFGEYMSWPFSCIRKYNHNDNIFNFECGRSSETGEGIFYFASFQANEIFDRVHITAKAIANSIIMHANRPPIYNAPRPPRISPQIPARPSQYINREPRTTRQSVGPGCPVGQTDKRASPFYTQMSLPPHATAPPPSLTTPIPSPPSSVIKRPTRQPPQVPRDRLNLTASRISIDRPLPMIPI